MTRYLRALSQLTYAGAERALQGALAKANEIGVPENISVVDAAGRLLAFARMDGARFFAQHSSLAKAQTAASLAMPTGHLPPQFGVELALATNGRSINMIGGLPIRVDGVIVGAIGVSSGSDNEDVAVAEAGCAAVVAALKDSPT
jgi:glc operon protein GlcG